MASLSIAINLCVDFVFTFLVAAYNQLQQSHSRAERHVLGRKRVGNRFGMGFRFPMQGPLYEVITEVENEVFYGFPIMDWYAFMITRSVDTRHD
ncbi:MAG TPA: hypothetical protein DCQ33_16100 [Nitrospira sp.]|nr:hypothetical protein [Nitrospira sp.]